MAHVLGIFLRGRMQEPEELTFDPKWIQEGLKIKVLGIR
jgi:hypothetical protein